MSKNQIKIGSALSYLQMAINVVIQLVYTPFMIRLLGQNEYGLYQTVASTVSMLSILSLGFNSGYIRYYALYRKKNDQDSINKLNGLFLLIFLLIGFVALLCGLFFSFNLDLVFDQGFTAAEYEKARILMLLLTFNLTISFPMSVFQNIISAHEQFIFLKILAMLKNILGPLVTLPLLLIGYRSITMVLVTVIVSLVVDTIYLIYVIKFMKEKFVFHDFEKGLFLSIFSYTFFIAVNTVIDQINWNIDKLLLGRFIGTGEVAIYSVGYTLYQCYMMFSSSISGVFTPRIHKLVNDTNNDINKQKKTLTDLFIKVGRIQFLVLGLIASGIIFFGDYFIVKIWAGEGYENAYIVSLLLILPASIALIQNLGIEIQRAENKHQFRSLAYAIMALVNLGLSIVLCQRFGAIGSAIGTAISLILANGIVMNIYYHKKCNIDIIEFWKNIVRLSLGLIIPIVIGVLISVFISFDSIIIYISFIIIYSLVYFLSMYFLGMNNYEKELIIKPIKKICRRVKP